MITFSPGFAEPDCHVRSIIGWPVEKDASLGAGSLIEKPALEVFAGIFPDRRIGENASSRRVVSFSRAEPPAASADNALRDHA